MINTNDPKVIAFPHSPGSGGPGSFQVRLESELRKRHWQITYASHAYTGKPDVILVVGGTRRLLWLAQMKIRGVPIVHRLDGLLWLHRAYKSRYDARFRIDAGLRNALSKIIHGVFANTIVYQSEFAAEWWGRERWSSPSFETVIQNGVDLNLFSPGSLPVSSRRFPDVVCLEGALDYTPYAIELMNSMAENLDKVGASLFVYGKFSSPIAERNLHKNIFWKGAIDRNQTPEAYRNRIYLSLDINAACPNTVVEALACGAPVLGYDTGAVKELVGDDAGEIIPFESDPWKGNKPSFAELFKGYLLIAADFQKYKRNARQRAEDRFDINSMVDSYIDIFQRTISR